MEMVDVYNERHEKLGYEKGRKDLDKGEYRLSCFVWIINDKNEILIQQRVATAKKYPNMWETVSGGAKAGEDSIQGSLTEVQEELGISLKKEQLKYIGCFTRFNDFVEVFIANINIDINDINMQEDEVQNVKWISIDEYSNMIQNGTAVATSYSLFLDYYNNYYKKHLEIIGDKPISGSD